MAKYRKLGKTSSQRKALLRNQITQLIYHGKIVTTEARAKEIRKIAEGIIALAVKERDNYETIEVDAKVPVKDKDGKRQKEVVDGKKITKYETVKKSIKKDAPSRLHARRQILKVLYPVVEVPIKDNNPNATVEVVWTYTWYDPTKEKQGALELLNRGCDVIEQHQDTTAPQVAAEEKGAYCIGYNVATPDAAPKAYLTAPTFHWNVFITDDIQKILDGTWESRKYWEGLNAGMVSLAPLSKLVAPGTAEKVAAAQKAIQDGSLQIFEGPIYDQNGVEKVPAGTVMTDDEVWNMEWFVKGVKGIIK